MNRTKRRKISGFELMTSMVEGTENKEEDERRKRRKKMRKRGDADWKHYFK
jgi:hypothetical protein